MSSQHFPPYGSTNNIKVELDLNFMLQKMMLEI